MPERSESQRIGASGQRLVEYIVAKSGIWIARRQDEDFGIDLEAELTEPSVRGHILKIQIKATEWVNVSADCIKVALEAKYLRLANDWRVPLVLVLADTISDQAWYLWLQGWVVEQRRFGNAAPWLRQDHVTVEIPQSDTLTAGLLGSLQEIARCQHRNQLVLSLIDTMRTAIATRSETVLVALAHLIGSVEAACKDFPIELLIDELVEQAARARFAWELSMLGRFVALLAATHGGSISKTNLLRLVAPNGSPSRAGLNALGAIYDAHDSHLRAMSLPEAFRALGCEEVAYYCGLREKFPGIKGTELAFGDFDYSVGASSLDIGDKDSFLNDWANRGESAYLDYFIPDERIS